MDFCFDDYSLFAVSMRYETSVWAMFSIFENMIMRHARDVIFPKFLTEFFQLALHTIVVEMIVTLVGIRRKLYSSVSIPQILLIHAKKES